MADLVKWINGYLQVTQEKVLSGFLEAIIVSITRIDNVKGE